MTNRRSHTAEFKRDAVQLALISSNFLDTARDLGINISLLWKQPPPLRVMTPLRPGRPVPH